MQPNTEPTPQDLAMVNAALGTTPQPAPQAPAPVAPEPQAPAPQMQPEPVTPQPSPTSQPLDPFAAFATQPTEPVAPQPTQPTEPTPNPQPQQPVEPSQPAPVQPPAPQAPAIPDQSAQGAPQYQTYEEYMAAVTDGLGDTPAMPDPAKIDPENPEAIKTFFDELINTAVQRAEQSVGRKQAVQDQERKLWDASFEKYGTLRTNKGLRDMVHNIRMGHFHRGIAITPLQAADKLIESLGHERRAGAADSAVITTIENVQPAGGGTGQPVPTTLDKDSTLLAVQTGGEAALAEVLDARIKAGQL